MLRTHWEPKKNSTPSPALPLFAPKEIKTEPLGCMFAHLIGCQEFLCLPLVFPIMARAEIVRHTVIQGQLQHMSAKQLLNFKASLLKIEHS
jgi:hypothetical protein